MSNTNRCAGHIEPKPAARPAVPVMGHDRRFRIRVPAPTGHMVDFDLTQQLTEAVANQLWQHFGGNSVVNWMQAEAIVDAICEAVQPAEGPIALRAAA